MAPGRFSPRVLDAFRKEWAAEQAWRDDQAKRFRFARLRHVGGVVGGLVRRFALDAFLAVTFVLLYVLVFLGGTRVAETISEWGITVQVAGGLLAFSGLLSLVGLRMAQRIEPEPADEDGVKPGRRHVGVVLAVVVAASAVSCVPRPDAPLRTFAIYRDGVEVWRGQGTSMSLDRGRGSDQACFTVYLIPPRGDYFDATTVGLWCGRDVSGGTVK